MARNSSSKLYTGAALAVGLVPALWTGPAMAQRDDAANESGLEEIVVTAQKRTENLQDVPISVQAFTQAALDEAGVKRVEDVVALVPGMTFGKSAGGSVTFLRGIGATDSTAGQEAPVSTYVDGVYRQSLYSNNIALKNVERIEVLKGPQGTLFGRNATGGLIHIITKTPSTETSGEMSFMVGNYETYEASAYATTELSDNVAIDFTGFVRRQEKGYGKNLVTGNDANYRHEKTAATKLFFDGDSTKLTAAIDYSDIDDVRGLEREVMPGAITSGGSTYNGKFYNVQHNVDYVVNTKAWGGSFQVDHDFGGAELVAITGYRNDKTHSIHDNDLSPAPITVGDIHYFTKLFTQEVRLAGEFGSGSTWIVGAFYLHSNAGVSVDVLAGPARFLAADFDTVIKTDSYAAFAEVGLQLSPRDRVTVGGRYTIDKRDPFGTIANVETAFSGQKKTWKEPTWRFVYDHHFTDDAMVYASYNRGFKERKLQRYPLSSAPYNPEIVDAFEVGSKLDLLDRRVRFNFSAFYYKYSDLQVRIIRTPITLVVNAAKAEIKGLEGEITAKVSNMLTFSAAGAYTDAKYKKWTENLPNFVPAIPGQRCPGVTTGPIPIGGNCTVILPAADLSGRQLIRSPKFTGNVGATLSIPSSVGEFTGTARLSYNDGFPWDNPSGRIRQDAYTLLNLGLGWRSSNDAFGVRLSAENVTGAHYAIAGTTVAEGDTYAAGSPALYSITLEAKF